MFRISSSLHADRDPRMGYFQQSRERDGVQVQSEEAAVAGHADGVALAVSADHTRLTVRRQFLERLLLRRSILLSSDAGAALRS